MFVFRTAVGRVRLAFTDRHGGVSSGPWSSLNLGTSNGDDPASVEQNLGILGAELGVQPGRLLRMSQLHTTDVRVVDDTTDLSDGVPYADALVSATPGVALLVRVADCVPVVLADPDAGVVGVVHAGRVGMAAGVCDRALDALRTTGAGHVRAWIGPRACGRCYEVPEAMRAEVSTAVPEAWSTTSWGTPALDLGAGVRAQLERSGVSVTDLSEQMSTCTIENHDYFSYRRQGQFSGRFGAVAVVVP